MAIEMTLNQGRLVQFVTQLPLPLLISNDPVLESTSNNVTVRKKNLKIPHTFFLKTM